MLCPTQHSDANKVAFPRHEKLCLYSDYPVRDEEPLFISVQRSGNPLHRWSERLVILTLGEAVLLVQSSVLVLIAENIPIFEQETVLRDTLCDGCYFHGRLSCLDGAQIFLVLEACNVVFPHIMASGFSLDPCL